MSRDFKVYLEDILRLIGRIEHSLRGLSYEQFIQDNDKIDALLYNLEIIGEAAKNIPEWVQTKYPVVEWRRIAALRNILVHEYFRVNMEIVWNIAQTELATLQSHMEIILRDSELET